MKYCERQRGNTRYCINRRAVHASRDAREIRSLHAGGPDTVQPDRVTTRCGKGSLRMGAEAILWRAHANSALMAALSQLLCWSVVDRRASNTSAVVTFWFEPLATSPIADALGAQTADSDAARLAGWRELTISLSHIPHCGAEYMSTSAFWFTL